MIKGGERTRAVSVFSSSPLSNSNAEERERESGATSRFEMCLNARLIVIGRFHDDSNSVKLFRADRGSQFQEVAIEENLVNRLTSFELLSGDADDEEMAVSLSLRSSSSIRKLNLKLGS